VNAVLSLLPAFMTDNPLPSAFVFLLGFGFVTPLCEEIAVILVGVTLHSTGTSLPLAVAVGLAALLIQDSAWFFLGRLLGPRLAGSRLLSRFIKPKTLADAGSYFSRRGPIVVFMARFVVGLRSAVILGSGFLGMRWSRFATYDSMAATVTTAVWMSVGYALGAGFDEKVGELTKIFGILGPAVVVAAAVLVYRFVMADKAKAAAHLVP